MSTVGYANWGLSSLHEFLGDLVVYRNLTPIDPRLPPFPALARRVGLDPERIPRKSELNYARVMGVLLQEARRLDAPDTEIKRLIYVGDTQLNDGTAFTNLCQVQAWPGLAFIGSERGGPPEARRVQVGPARTLYLANRWSMLHEFNRFCAQQAFPIDAETAVVIDLDKTALGARGRNDKVINQARLDAVRQTVQGLLGDTFDIQVFEQSYHTLNQTEFHPFTTDNQDYLAYLCLIIGMGVISLDALIQEIRGGELKAFEQVLERVDRRAATLPRGLGTLHRDIYARVRAGDPTPFKRFRHMEYRTTVARMGHLAADAEVSDLLTHEITLTEEVREIAHLWRSRGALLFGLSDKPDEASLPDEALQKQGYQPIHRTPTHAVGERIFPLPG